MLFSEWIRRKGFWVLDFLTGSKVRRHYTDIRNIMENNANPNVEKTRQMHLINILNYATKNVEFYRPFKGLDSIGSFPVINKNIIRENYEAFQSPEFLGATVLNLHTSGSTGTPFIVRQDRNKRNRVYAEMMYFWGKAGYQIGERYVFFRVWTSANRKSRLTAWARNIVMVDVRLQNEAKLERIRDIFRSDHKIKMIIGFPSFLEVLADQILFHGDIPEILGINTIIAYAEPLPEVTYDKLKKAFNCPVVSLYSNQENGTLALECVGNKELHVNNASYKIELLKINSNEPVGVGESGRIVVTDLFNHAMPLIRYDTGDIGIWKNAAECDWNTQVLSSVQGRLIDIIYDTKGNKVSPHTINILMWPFDKLLQYQFIQENARQYVLKLNGAEGHYEDTTFVDLLRNVLGQDAEIVIQHVHEIPVLDSGKRKLVMTNYHKEKNN